ncbi:MAG: THxN family PEP-CTERM protein [Pseudomonadota bacterium]
MRMIKIGAAAAAFTLVASSAFAATVTIESVTGAWTAVSQNNAHGVTISNSGGSSEVTWGEAPKNGSQSSYSFERTIPPSIVAAPGEEFAMGKFTHHNWPIYTKPSDGAETAIDWAELQVDFQVKIDDVVYDFTRNYRFDHSETPNKGVKGACMYGGNNGDAGVNKNGCADRVVASLNEAGSETLVVDGLAYTFDISGFEVGGQTMDFFLTKENASNEATLVGTYNVSPVPLPAAGWMLIAGLGGLVAMKRRRARAEA